MPSHSSTRRRRALITCWTTDSIYPSLVRKPGSHRLEARPLPDRRPRCTVLFGRVLVCQAGAPVTVAAGVVMVFSAGMRIHRIG